MPIGEVIHLLKTLRLESAGDMESLLETLQEGLGRLFKLDSLVMHIPEEEVVYVTRWPSGMNRSSLSEVLNISSPDSWRWVVLDTDGDNTSFNRTQDLTGNEISVYKIPIYSLSSRAGSLSVLGWGKGLFDDLDDDLLPILSEIISIRVAPMMESVPKGLSLKHQLLDAVGNDGAVKNVISYIMELSQADYCGFLASAEKSLLYLMLAAPELSGSVNEIIDKITTTYGMFTNTPASISEISERLFYRQKAGGGVYSEDNSSVESYFIVPVMERGRVGGVLFLGSVREGAFVKENISIFKSMADDDVDGETRAGFSLRSNIEILNRWLSVIPLGCAAISTRGDVISSNQRFWELLGIRGQLPGNITEVNMSCDYNLNGFWKELTSNGNEMRERVLSSDSDSTGFLSVTWMISPEQRDGIGSFIVLRDITRQKKQREDERKFVATVAHELRTPLTALKNSLKILMQVTGDNDEVNIERSSGLGKTAEKFLTTALRTLNKLSVLVDGLVDVYKLSGEAGVSSTRIVDVETFIREASTLFVESMNKKGISFSVETEEEVSGIELDRNRMEQVIQNLLSNSVKSTVSGGEISITASVAEKTAGELFPLVPWEYLSSAQLIDISVRDSGSGIPEEISDYISGDETDYRSEVSPGLGLMISKELVKRHGGKIEIESAPGRGSVVHIYLFRKLANGMLVRKVGSIKEMVELFLGRGKTPLLYTLVKEDARCWIEMSGRWRMKPVVEPEQSEINDNRLYLWPLSGRLAIAVTCDTELIEEPISMLSAGREELRVINAGDKGGIDVGWAVSPRDGIKFAELLSSSLSMVKTRITTSV
jgi:signal transduction histidine kinase